MRGAIAQLVEQRTENPCVPGSIPGGTTKKTLRVSQGLFFVLGFIYLLTPCIVFFLAADGVGPAGSPKNLLIFGGLWNVVETSCLGC